MAITTPISIEIPEGLNTSGQQKDSASTDTTGATLIIIHVGQYNPGTTVATPTDNKGNTYTSLTAQAFGDVRSTLFYCVNPTVGTGHVFTIPGSGSGNYCNGQVLAFPGAGVLDQETGTASASASQPGSLTPSEAGCVVVVGWTCFNGSPGSINGGFTITDQAVGAGGSNYGGGIAYLIQTTATAANPTITTNDAGSAVAINSAVFKSAGGGGSTGTAAGAATVSAAGKSDAATTATAAAGTATVSGVGGTLTALVSSVFKNNTGTPLASLTNVTAWVYHPVTGALVVKLSTQATNGSGVLTMQDAAIVSGTTYRVVFRNEADGAEGMETLTAS